MKRIVALAAALVACAVTVTLAGQTIEFRDDLGGCPVGSHAVVEGRPHTVNGAIVLDPIVECQP